MKDKNEIGNVQDTENVVLGQSPDVFTVKEIIRAENDNRLHRKKYYHVFSLHFLYRKVICCKKRVKR